MNILIKILLFIIIIILTNFLFARIYMLDGGLFSRFVPTTEEPEEEFNSGKDKEGIRIVDGNKAIQLDEEVIAVSGIKSEKLTSMIFTPEFTAHAEIIDIAPLVSARTDYLNLLAEQKVLQRELHDHHQILKRAESLNKTKSLTTRELEKIRADYDLKYSRSNAMKTRLEGFTYQLKSNWGEVISSLILDQEKQPDFDRLASNQASLVLVSLLKNQTLTDPQQKVFVSSRNQRETAIQAGYLDQTRKISNPLYGESYLYLLHMQKLSAGLRLFAWVEEYGEPVSGLFVPEKAVIWYANEPWIYIRHDHDLFIRKPLGSARKLDDGWFLEDPLMEDKWVVISGGQTLLSEEFKWAIPDENAD